MLPLIFKNLSPKDFERFCADLEEEGYVIESEPFVDRTGVDIMARMTYRSHNNNHEVTQRWRVQCKRYEKRLGRNEIEECLYSFDANRQPNEMLLIMVASDYSEPAIEVIQNYIRRNPHISIDLWNQRKLITLLEKYPRLLTRYQFPQTKTDFLPEFSTLANCGAVKTLLISDQSVLAHNLTSVLRSVGFDITFLPFWNYSSASRMTLNSRSVLGRDFELVICFLGDSFSFPMPLELTDVILRCYRNGTPCLLFPFLAWSIKRGIYDEIEQIIPVQLRDPSVDMPAGRVVGGYRFGDFRWLLAFDSFAEDQYTELDPQSSYLPFTNGIEGPFGLSHSFEYLDVKKGANLVWADTTGNPMVVTKESGSGKVCYLNTCGHSCMNPVALSSPLEVSPQFGYLMNNILKWLLK